MMTGASAKSPQKRKSLASDGTASATPKKAKIDINLNKSKTGTTPGKGVTPNKQAPKPEVKIAGQKITGKKNAPQKNVLSPKKPVGFPAKTQAKDKKQKPTVGANGIGSKKKNTPFYKLQKSIEAKSDLKSALSTIEAKIADIEGRDKKTKTGARKLKLLKKFKKIVENGGEMPVSVVQTQTSKKLQKKNVSKTTKPLAAKTAASQKKEVKILKQKVIKPPKVAEEEEDSESDYDVESAVKVTGDSDNESGDEEQSDESDEASDQDNEEDSDEEGSEDEEEGSGDEEEVSGDEEEDSEDEEDSGDEEEKKVTVKPQISKKPTNGTAGKDQKKFVVFVGNLPFDATKEDISEHFAKVGKIKDVSLPLNQQTGKSRGFSFVELANEEAYKKALELHHTSVKGREINVSCSEARKKAPFKKNDFKGKNFKSFGKRPFAGKR